MGDDLQGKNITIGFDCQFEVPIKRLDISA